MSTLTLLGTDNQKTFYSLAENTLSRTVGNKFHSINLREDNSIQKVHRLSNLDDESFALMSGVQKRRRPDDL